jgi:Fe2+ or Zn2+ uptake regulation protein
MSIEHKEVLLEQKIRPSIIRLNVYQYLFLNKGHRTVDEIYQNLMEIIPTLSKTSIYNVLSLFTEKGLVKPVNINPNETRYELVCDKHSHFMCNVCGELYDIPYHPVTVNDTELNDFLVETQEVLLKGTCPKCK